MTLTLRDPEVIRMVRELASLRGISEADAITAALAAELRREKEALSVSERVAAIADRMMAAAGPNGQEMTKADIDAMWGQ
jgi:hypothetical protein